MSNVNEVTASQCALEGVTNRGFLRVCSLWGSIGWRCCTRMSTGASWPMRWCVGRGHNALSFMPVSGYLHTPVV
jgi:hypothetical protein